MLSPENHKESIAPILEVLGLTQQEKDVYITSLIRGPSTAAELADEVGITRPNIYKILSSLGRRGLLPDTNKKPRGEKINILPPTVLSELVEKAQSKNSDCLKIFKNHLPEIQSLYQQGGVPTRVRLLEGKENFLKIFNQVLDESSDAIRYFGSATDLIQFISWQEEERWIAKRLKKKLFIQCLVTASNDAEILKKKDAQELRETRIYKGEGDLVGSYLVFSNKIVFLQPRTPIVLLIEDAYIVSLQKSSFDFMWLAHK